MSTRTICFQLVEISTMPPSLQTSSNPYMLEEWHPGLGIGAKMACGLDSALICVCSLSLWHRDCISKPKREK